MLDCGSIFGLSFDPLKGTFLLYKRVTEQYRNPEILKIIRSLIPDNIVSQAKDDGSVVSLLKWFKDDFMRWTPKDPVCERCIAANSHDYNCAVSNSSTVSRSSAAPMMQARFHKAKAEY
jgi:hypothetical protein